MNEGADTDAARKATQSKSKSPGTLATPAQNPRVTLARNTALALTRPNAAGQVLPCLHHDIVAALCKAAAIRQTETEIHEKRWRNVRGLPGGGNAGGEERGAERTRNFERDS